MKQCPKCNFTCDDSDIICKNCGYLFDMNGNAATGTDGGANPGTPGNPGNNPYAQNPYSQPQQPSQPQYQNPYETNTNMNSNGTPYNPNQYVGYNEQKNDGLAIASLVLGIVGAIPCCSSFLIPSILAIVFGFVSKNKIKLSNGGIKGNGLALAGIILGFVGIFFFIIAMVRMSAYGFDVNRILEEARRSSNY